jgi:hypothetical protein
MRLSTFILITAAAGCALDPESAGETLTETGGESGDDTTSATAATESSSASASSSSSSSASGSSTTEDSESSSTSGGGDTSGSSTGDGVVACYDAEPFPSEVEFMASCDAFDQDCPAGTRCTYWANDGGVLLNATRCVPIDPAPAQPGDVCEVMGTEVSGIDTCDLGSQCYWVDPLSNEGVCVPFAIGSLETPACDDPGDVLIAAHGAALLCVPTCDPADQPCAFGSCAYAYGQWVCLEPHALAGAGDCTTPDGCEAGSSCIEGSCLEHCDVGGDCGSCATPCDEPMAEFGVCR